MTSPSSAPRPGLTGGKAVLRFLEQNTSGTVFGLPGSASVPIFHGFPDTDLRFIQALHEGAALATADGFSRISGLTGVLLYMAPGTATAMSNLYNASRDGSRLLLIISQQSSTSRWGQGSVGEADIVDMVRPFSRFAREVTNAEQLIPLLEAAARASSGQPSGPAAVVVPEDILRSEVAWPTSVARHREPTVPDHYDQIVDRFVTSERPLVVVGGQLRRTGGSAAIEQFAQLFHVPVMYEPFWNDRLGVSPSHDTVLGQLSERSSVAATADWVLVIGCRMFNEVHPRKDPWFDPTTFVGHVNADPDALEHSMPATWSCLADPGSFAFELLEACRRLPPSAKVLSARLERLTAARDRRRAPRPGPYSAVIDALAIEPDKAFLVDESVSANQALMSGLRCDRGERYMSTTGGSLGWGIGAASGVALATREPVTCVVGDGAFFFGLQGLWPAVDLGLPITFVVIDNGGFDSTRWFESRYAESRGSGAPSFVGSTFRSSIRSVTGVAEGFGIKSHEVLDVDLGRKLDEVRGSGPVLLHVLVRGESELET